MASPTVLRDALDLAPGDKKGELTLSLYPSLGCVLTFHATDLIFNLIQSLPRSLLSQVHEELTQVLRRDIIGDLPRELAVLIFVRLDTKSLLACGAVSRAWYAAANDQSLWHIRCADHNIHPHPSTSWRDVFTQRDRIQRQKAETDALQDMTRARQRQQQRGEGAGEGDIWDDEYERSLAVGEESDGPLRSNGRGIASTGAFGSALDHSLFTGRNAVMGGNLSVAGLRRDVHERSVHGSPLDAGSPVLDLTENIDSAGNSAQAPRRPSFRTGRHQSGLPIFLLSDSGAQNPTNGTVTSGSSAPYGPTLRTGLSPPGLTGASLPIASHSHEPFPKPLVNYKHLYLVHRIIKQRFISGRQRPYILDSRTSWQGGGLEGHREGIYCLQILHEELVVPTTTPSAQPAAPQSPTRRAVDPSINHTGASFTGSAPPRSASASTVEGRNWVLSGSRDKTVRLWDLDTMRVVKIYQSDPASAQGHTNSVLTLHARVVPAALTDASGLTGGAGVRAAAGKCVKMITGGSDGRLVIWDVLTGKILGQIQAHDRGESVLCVRFDEKRIVSCSKDRSIRTFDSKTLEPLLVLGGSNPNVGVLAENHRLDADIPGPHDIEGHRAAVNAIELVKDYIISVSGDRTLRVWSAQSGECMLIIDAHSRGIASLDIDIGSGTCITGSSDWGIRRHELGEWGLDIGQGDTAVNAGEDDDDGASSEYPAIRPRRSSHALRGDSTANAHSALSASINQLEIGPRQVRHPHGFEFRAGRGCCIATRSRYFPLSSLTSTQSHGEGSHQSGGLFGATGFVGSASGASTPSGGHACFDCEKKGHTDLVRSLWLGDDVVFSGSYDSKLKVWDRHTGLLIKDLPDLHTGRIFSVVGDKTKVVSSGIDQRIVIWDFAHGLDTSFVDM